MGIEGCRGRFECGGRHLFCLGKNGKGGGAY